jgi:hypothetical protein
MKITFLKDDSYILAGLGAKISQSPFEKTINELYDEAKDVEKSKKLVRNIVDKNKHRIFDDFTETAFVFDGITRAGAIYFWRNISSLNLMSGAGLETSLRVIKPTNYNSSITELAEASKSCYDDAINDGMPEQDARYVLPEGTETRVIFSSTKRYYSKLATALKDNSLPEINEIGKTIEDVINKEYGMKATDEKLPSKWDVFGHWDYFNECTSINMSFNSDFSFSSGSNIDAHSLSLDMGARASLSMLAQLVRQRPNLIEIEPFEDIVKSATFVSPPTFSDRIKEHYRQLAEYASEFQAHLLERKDPNFVYGLLLGQQARFKLKAKGYGIVETAKERVEGVAQWEIRNTVGIPLTKKLSNYEELRKEIGPRCYREGRCTEPPNFKNKFNVCPIQAAGGRGDKNLDECLEILTPKDISTFTVRK